MKRPLGWVALFYAGGVLLAGVFQPALLVLFGASLALGIATLLFRHARPWLLGSLLILAGWTSTVFRTAQVSPQDLRALQSTEPALVSLRGVLEETPTERTYTTAGVKRSRTLAILRVTELSRQSARWQPAFGRVLLTTRGTLPPNAFAGQAVEIHGVLQPPPQAKAEGLFDYSAYLRRQQIYFQLKADSDKDWQLLPPVRGPSWSDSFLDWAEHTLARGLPDQDLSFHLLAAMTLGSKDGMTQETYEPFQQSGTMHIFAISGLHIALICAILVSLLRLVRVSRLWCGVVIVPLIWFYTAATGWQPSAIRSTIMMTVIIVGWSLKRPSDLINSLAAAAFIILLWDPQQLFGASFQLSFFVVLSIALLLPPLEKLRDRLIKLNPLVPEDLAPAWKRHGVAAGRWSFSFFAVSLAAWIGALPLTAFYFHLFSPITLLANLIIVPLSSAALACNLGSLICGALLIPWLPELLNHSAWFWMTCMVKLSQWSTLIPFGFWYVRSPSAIDFLLYYGLLIAWLAGWFARARARRWLISFFAALALASAWFWLKPHTETTITIISGDGGLMVYSDEPGSHNDLLIDPGNANAIKFVTTPFLHSKGVNSLPAMLLTHGDARHTGGATNVIERFHPVRIHASPARSRSPSYRAALEQARRRDARLESVSQGERIGQWTVLHPGPDDRFPRADDSAVALLRDFGCIRILLLSDLGPQGQAALLQRNPGLKADIIVTGIPSQGEPLSDELLAAVQPSIIVVSDSDFPAAERASDQLRARLKKQTARVLYASATGTITLKIKPTEWTLNSSAEANQPGSEKHIREDLTTDNPATDSDSEP